MQIISPAFGNSQPIPSKYTCDGSNVSPPLEFKEIPANVLSLALIVDDPDAPNGDWVHWLVWNIPPTPQSISENSVPRGGVQGTTDFGQAKYGGPCPPSGVHHYFFKLYALDRLLSLSSSSTKKDLEKAMQNYIISQAELVGKYARK